MEVHGRLAGASGGFHGCFQGGLPRPSRPSVRGHLRLAGLRNVAATAGVRRSTQSTDMPAALTVSEGAAGGLGDLLKV